MLRLHDTATGTVHELARREAGRVSMYVCGSTVYELPHIGHGRFTLVYDILRRYLEFSGMEVDHVSNVTDVDDKIIRRSNIEGRPWKEIAEEFEEKWWLAMDAMGARRPTATPHASDFIDEMIAVIGRLFERSLAYETSDGVYLPVNDVPGYGLLAHQSLGSLRAGARVEVVEEKRSPLDFALWKKAKPDEPTWESPYGPGRPGWHTECVVMSLGLLGEGFDLHGGGQDLIFPHHENERAQAVALGRQFARHWMHNGMVEVGGEKMAKSSGNFTTIPDLLAEHDPRAYRMLVVRSKYRSPIEVTPGTLADAERALGRLDALGRRRRLLRGAAGTGVKESTEPREPDGIDAETLRRFVERMDDDLDTPAAVGVIFEAVTMANTLADRGDDVAAARLARTVEHLAEVLGIEMSGADEVVGEEPSDLLRRHDEARAARDFAAADSLRERLSALGWVVENTPSGTRIHR